MATSKSSAGRNAKIAAIKRLSSIYLAVADFQNPGDFEFGKDDEAIRKDYVTERRHSLLDLMRRVEAARKCLLATGFQVPDSWLTVEYAGRQSAREDQAGIYTFSVSRVDSAKLKHVCDEMYAARLRLENAPHAGEVQAGRNNKTPVAIRKNTLKDGPCTPKGFRWDGKPFELEEKAAGLLRVLWPAGTKTDDEIIKLVWGEDRDTKGGAALKSACARARNVIVESRAPFTLRQYRGTVVLSRQ